jgi:hypothetical protein
MGLISRWMAEEREAFEKHCYTIMTAEPSELLRRVFDEHTQHYGDPDMHYPFESEKSVFGRLDVFTWHPHDAIPMTTFTTIGMADHIMNGCDHRCEIHLTMRKKLPEEEESEAAACLANLAAFPFLKKTFFDYWHIVPGLRIPGFAKCPFGLFHPALTKDGWDTIALGNLKIKILNLIPITIQENGMAIQSGVNKMLDDLYAHHVDIFSDRT